ncbi:helix-turn-helix domain-containing protein [Paenibacillus senegalimassiliensis]|uniref:helix-turn-helix domain-containing protein n=1 Tax=Paenibacillus senegalimassiliensis TaxID=1737426 RepID=UPI00073EE461
MGERLKITKVEDLPDVCSPQVVADFLGLSRDTVYELCQLSIDHGGLPSYTIGASRKIDLDDLLKWKENQKNKQLRKSN